MKESVNASEISVSNLKKFAKQQQQANEQVKATEEKYAMIKQMNFALEQRILELQSARSLNSWKKNGEMESKNK